jgi:hypothetical protein
MSTRADLRARIRAELNDTSVTTPLYSDALLNGWLNDGLGQLSLDLPQLVNNSALVQPGARVIALNSFSIAAFGGGIRTLEFPAGRPIPRGDTSYRTEDSTAAGWPSPTGVENYRQIYPQCWDFQNIPYPDGLGGTPITPCLVFRYALLDPAFSGAFQYANIWYWSNYLPLTDDITPATVLVYDEPLLTYYVAGRAISWLAEQRGKRGDSGSVANRSNATYYERLYLNGLKIRKQAKGVQSNVVHPIT